MGARASTCEFGGDKVQLKTELSEKEEEMPEF